MSLCTPEIQETIMPEKAVDLIFDDKFRLSNEMRLELIRTCDIEFINLGEHALIICNYKDKEMYVSTCKDIMNVEMINYGAAKVNDEHMVTGTLMTKASAESYHKLLLANDVPHDYTM